MKYEPTYESTVGMHPNWPLSRRDIHAAELHGYRKGVEALRDAAMKALPAGGWLAGQVEIIAHGLRTGPGSEKEGAE